MASTPAMATRCFCPPESAAVSRFSNPCRPTSASAADTRSRSSSVGTPKFSGPNATSFSMRLATSWSSGFWKTMPAWLRMKYTLSLSRVSRPSTLTRPSSGASRALTCFARVDFPEPLPPSMQTNSPCDMLAPTPSSTNVSPS